MRNLITIVILFIGCSTSFGQIKFFNLYTNNGSDQGQGIVQLEDSSYVITGSSSSFTGSAQAFLMKIDSLGNYIWSNHYGGAESESGRRVLYKKGFGYFICGFTNSFGAGDFDNYLVKVDENGIFEWEKSYGGTGWERVHDAALTRDTGTIMVGETSSNETDNQDIYIVRTDIQGDTLWTKTIGGTGADIATCIKAYTDSTFVVGGQTYVEDSLLTKGYMIHLHEDGTILWESTFGANGDYWVGDFVFNGPIMAGIGGTVGDLTDDVDLFIFTHYMDGVFGGGYNVLYEGDADGKSMVRFGATNDYYLGFHAINQFTYDNGSDINISKHLQTGLAWEETIPIGFENPDVIGDMIPTSDNGAIMVGYTTGVISGGNEIFVAKIGPNDDYPFIDNSSTQNVVALDEITVLHDWRIYPNPAETFVNVSTDNINYTYVRLYNSLGELAAQHDFSMKQKIDVSALNAGLYLIEIGGENLTPSRSQLIVK